MTSERAVRVVVAEDEALIRLDLVEMLRELGYDVVGQVGDGQAAVDTVRELRPDVVLLDIAMPKRDGLSAAEEIAQAGTTAVVMVTAFSQREPVARATEAGVSGYLVKPFTASDLAPAIEVALARWAQVQGLSADIASLTQRLADRDLVDAAKARIQLAYGLSEADAFGLLRRQAMDARVTLAEVAAEVLAHPESGKSPKSS